MSVGLDIGTVVGIILTIAAGLTAWFWRAVSTRIERALADAVRGLNDAVAMVRTDIALIKQRIEQLENEAHDNKTLSREVAALQIHVKNVEATTARVENMLGLLVGMPNGIRHPPAE